MKNKNNCRTRFILGMVFLVYFPAVALAIDAGKIKLNGFVDAEYEKSDHATLGDPNGSFDQHNFNLLSEYSITDTVTAKLHLEYEHSPNTENNAGNIILEWSYLEFILSNTTKIRIGKNLTPFGIYNEVHDASPTRAFIRIPWGIFRTDEVGGHAMFPEHSTGIYVMGNYFTPHNTNLNYVVYVTNGENETLNEAETDENKNKAIGARIEFSPIGDLNFGASYYTDEKGLAKTDHSTWGVSAEYAPFPLAGRAEYASSELGDVTETSWYAEATYTYKAITPFVRYGMLDPDDKIGNDQWTEFVVGIAYQLQPNVILKLENRSIGGESGNSQVNDDYNEIGAAITVAF